MKILKKVLFISAAFFCFTIAVSAQKTDKTPIPKGTPPVIVVPPKNNEKPKDEKPKDDKQKPNMATLDLPRKFEIESV